MHPPDDDIENARIAENLRRAIELTELALALRQAVLQQGGSDGRHGRRRCATSGERKSWSGDRVIPNTDALKAHLRFLSSAE